MRSEADLFIAYSPEREDPGNADYGTARIPKVVGGDGPKAAAAAAALYGQFVERLVPVSATRNRQRPSSSPRTSSAPSTSRS